MDNNDKCILWRKKPPPNIVHYLYRSISNFISIKKEYSHIGITVTQSIRILLENLFKYGILIVHYFH